MSSLHFTFCSSTQLQYPRRNFNTSMYLSPRALPRSLSESHLRVCFTFEYWSPVFWFFELGAKFPHISPVVSSPVFVLRNLFPQLHTLLIFGLLAVLAPQCNFARIVIPSSSVPLLYFAPGTFKYSIISLPQSRYCVSISVVPPCQIDLYQTSTGYRCALSNRSRGSSSKSPTFEDFFSCFSIIPLPRY